MRLLGVIGTMVWDTIRRESHPGSSVEEWGGISYALAAADAIAPVGLRVRPILKLGRDLAERGFAFLRSLSIIETDQSVIIGDAPNPRVELRYRGAERYCERLRGEVLPWSWEELAAHIEGCDALYVNFITGYELDLEIAQVMRRHFKGPIYADIHSLMLARGPRGERSLRPLRRWDEWLACFDIVQVNEDELRFLATERGDPWAFAADAIGSTTELLLVTLGPGGAAYVMSENAPSCFGSRRSGTTGSGLTRTGRINVECVREGDPTGCGDVWGIAALLGLIEGLDIEAAIRRANRTAGANVSYRGTSGLSDYLRDEIGVG